jgi:hypothetical protein
MLLALQRTLVPGIGDRTGAQLSVTVVFTTVGWTLEALRKAGSLASQLGGCITLLVPQVVPYPLPLESPPVLIDWSERRFRVIAEESTVETKVRLYLCRDRLSTLLRILKPASVVVIGCRKRWGPTPEKRLARQLRRAAHEVILVETE